MSCTINASTSTGLVETADLSGSLQFQTNSGTTAMTIDTSQNVGIGTTSPATKLHVSSGNSTNLAVNGSTKGVRFDFDSTQTSIVGVDNTFFATYQPLFIGGSYLAFGNGITEKMRLDSSGRLLIGTTSLSVPAGGWNPLLNILGGNAAFFKSNSIGSVVTGFQVAQNTDLACGFYNASASLVGTIVVNSGSVAYNTSSDYRLKENIAPMTGALDKVAQLKPVTYTWKSDGLNGQGFIAHELQEVVPDCVTGEKDAVRIVDELDAEGKVIGQKEEPVYQGIDTSFLVATLTAAIQEQQAIINDLKARIETLESK